MKKIFLNIAFITASAICHGQQSEISFVHQNINFSAAPRTSLSPMSIKLWDNYYNGGPTAIGTVLEFYGLHGHSTGQLYFGGYNNSKIHYRDASYGQNSWSSWTTLLDSKNDLESNGRLMLTGNGNHFINQGNFGLGTITPDYLLHLKQSQPTINFEKAGVLNWTIGNLSGNDFYIRADNGTQNPFVIASGTGNVGIGIQSPSQRLTVSGNMNIVDPTGGNYLGFGVPSVNEYNTVGSLYSNAALTLSHGLKPHSSSSALIYSHPNMNRNAIVLGGFGENGIKFYTKGQSIETVGGAFVEDPKMVLLNDGNVGIGTATPKEKLSVNGKIRAKEVKVEMANWPDYVFETDYKQKSLSALETFIKQNKHLPEVPSAKEVEKNGIELGEMNKILLKKIEELTLHLIQKDKEIKKLAEVVKEVKKNMKLSKNQ